MDCQKGREATLRLPKRGGKTYCRPWMGLAWAILTAAGFSLQAQPYVLEWTTLASGGGVSAGGAYVGGATVGQSIVGVARVADRKYTSLAGFWSLPVAARAGEPSELAITWADDTVTLIWPRPAPGWQPETALDLNPPIEWTTVPPPYETNATQIQVTLPAREATEYFRLRKPEWPPAG